MIDHQTADKGLHRLGIPSSVAKSLEEKIDQIIEGLADRELEYVCPECNQDLPICKRCFFCDIVFVAPRPEKGVLKWGFRYRKDKDGLLTPIDYGLLTVVDHEAILAKILLFLGLTRKDLSRKKLRNTRSRTSVFCGLGSLWLLRIIRCLHHVRIDLPYRSSMIPNAKEIGVIDRVRIRHNSWSYIQLKSVEEITPEFIEAIQEIKRLRVKEKLSIFPVK